MMRNSKTVWVDLTMLINHQGQLTGIQRVEYNLAKRFLAKDYVKFCVYDKSSNELYPYEFSLIEEKILALQYKQKNIVSEEVEIDMLSNILHSGALASLKMTLKKITPVPIKKRLRTSVDKYRAGKGAKQTALSPILLQKGDTLLILSGDWSEELFFNKVQTLKNQTDLKILQIDYDMLPSFYPQNFVRSEEHTSELQSPDH